MFPYIGNELLMAVIIHKIKGMSLDGNFSQYFRFNIYYIRTRLESVYVGYYSQTNDANRFCFELPIVHSFPILFSILCAF